MLPSPVICPNCHAEYREGITVCVTDGEALVDSLPEETGAAFLELEHALSEGTATLSAPRAMDDAQRDQELLHEAGVPCLLYADPNSAGPNGAPRSYHLALLPRHLEAALAALGRQRSRMLATEGLRATETAVDLTAAEITCPACGFQFPRADTCPDCGLFLGKDGAA
jgi:hypothetical protein